MLEITALTTQALAPCIQAAAPCTQVEPTVDGTLPDEVWLGGRGDEVGRFQGAYDYTYYDYSYSDRAYSDFTY